MRRLITVVLAILFISGCASAEYVKIMESYHQVEKERVALAGKVVEIQKKMAEKDLFWIDLNKDGSVDKIHVGQQYFPLDPAVATVLGKQLPMPKNPSIEGWREFFGFGKTLTQWGLGAWAVTEVADTIADSAGDHSTHTDQSRTYDMGDENVVGTDGSEIDIEIQDNDTITTTTETTTTTTETNTDSSTNN